MKELYEQNKPLFIAGVALILFVLLGLGAAAVIRMVSNKTKAPQAPTQPPQSTPEQQLANALDNYDATPLALELVSTVTANAFWDSGERCAAYKAAMQLTDNQLIAVNKKFKEQHPNQFSIKQAMDKTWTNACIAYNNDWGDSLHERLIKLGL